MNDISLRAFAIFPFALIWPAINALIILTFPWRNRLLRSAETSKMTSGSISHSPSHGFVPHVEGYNTVRIAQSKLDYYSSIGQHEAYLRIASHQIEQGSISLVRFIHIPKRAHVLPSRAGRADPAYMNFISVGCNQKDRLFHEMKVRELLNTFWKKNTFTLNEKLLKYIWQNETYQGHHLPLIRK